MRSFEDYTNYAISKSGQISVITLVGEPEQDDSNFGEVYVAVQPFFSLT